MIYSLMDACREDMPQYANKLAFQFQSLLKDDYEATRREHQLFSPLATRLVEMLSTVAESYSITRVLEEGDGTLLTALAKIGHCLTGQGILEPERPLIEHMRGMGVLTECYKYTQMCSNISIKVPTACISCKARDFSRYARDS